MNINEMEEDFCCTFYNNLNNQQQNVCNYLFLSFYDIYVDSSPHGSGVLERTFTGLRKG